MENRCYGGIATWGHFTCYKLYTIDFEGYSFLFISKKHHTKKYGRYLHSEVLTSFLNISVMEAYILKRDILVITLFAMFLSNSE